jgi:hypothetical protein
MKAYLHINSTYAKNRGDLYGKPLDVASIEGAEVVLSIPRRLLNIAPDPEKRVLCRYPLAAVSHFDGRIEFEVKTGPITLAEIQPNATFLGAPGSDYDGLFLTISDVRSVGVMRDVKLIFFQFRPIDHKPGEMYASRCDDPVKTGVANVQASADTDLALYFARL